MSLSAHWTDYKEIIPKYENKTNNLKYNTKYLHAINRMILFAPW